MQLTVSVNGSDQIVSVDVASDMVLADFKAYVEAETAIAPQNQRLIVDGKPLDGDDKKTLEQLLVKNGDLILLTNAAGAAVPASSAGAAGAGANATAGATDAEISQRVEFLRQQLLANPQLRQQFPPQLESLLNDPEQFKTWFRTYVENNPFAASAGAGAGASAEIARLERDPDNPENQKRILELIHQEQIDENMRNAIEYSPETFATVTMLYVNVELNGHKVKAFVDSGAQRTILSSKLAEECGIARLIDRRFRGQAIGVGLGEIIGQIHSVPLKIENTFFPCSFTILDTNVDFLLGLDMLKRHRGVIDLDKNVLKINTEETPFLPENEIPKSVLNDPTLLGQQQPGSTTLSGIKLGGNIFDLQDANNKRQKTEPSAGASSSQGASSAAANAALARHSTGASSSSAAAKPKYDEAVVQQVMGLGFSRAQVIDALDKTGGNAEYASALLFE